MPVIRKCRYCAKHLPLDSPNHKMFCSTKCSRRNYQLKFERQSIGLSTGTTGAIQELRACADLLAMGYFVFRSISPACAFDLVVMKDGKMSTVEVRTAVRNPYTNSICKNRNLKGEPKPDYYAFCLKGEIIYEPPLPTA